MRSEWTLWLHEAAPGSLLKRRRAGISLVDAASFLVMRTNGIEEAFAFDPHSARPDSRS